MEYVQKSNWTSLVPAVTARVVVQLLTHSFTHPRGSGWVQLFPYLQGLKVAEMVPGNPSQKQIVFWVQRPFIMLHEGSRSLEISQCGYQSLLLLWMAVDMDLLSVVFALWADIPQQTLDACMSLTSATQEMPSDIWQPPPSKRELKNTAEFLRGLLAAKISAWAHMTPTLTAISVRDSCM